MNEEPNNTVDSSAREPEAGPSAAPTPDTAHPSATLEPAAGSPSPSTAETETGDAGRRPAEREEYPESIRRILDVQLPVTVSFGATRRSLQDVLKLSPGALIELDKSADEPVVLKINDKPFAWGNVVDVDGYYGIEITEILTQADRIASLGGD